jgi:uncharacterized protein YbjT (DUF2867 family)
MLLGKPILVVGAGGLFGRYVAPELIVKSARVRGLVHHDRAEAVARSTGVTDIVRADLRDEKAVRRALDGIGGVFYIPPKFLPDEAELGVRLVELAAEAGVERFVFSGVMYPFITDMHNHHAKLPVELALIKSGMAFTILLPTNLMQSTEAFFWAKVLETGEYVEPWAQDKKICYVDYRDVAEVAAKALAEDGLQHGVFDLSAAGVISREDIVAMMTEALGRPITTRTQPIDEWNNENMPPDLVLRNAFADIDRFYSRYGFPGGNDLVLRTILGRPPRTMKAYINELAARSLGMTHPGKRTAIWSERRHFRD